MPGRYLVGLMRSRTLRRLAPLALVALLAASCGDNDKKANTTTTTQPPLAQPPTDTTAATGGTPSKSKANTLLVGTQDIYPLLGGDLTDLAPNQVLGHSTRVIALAGPDGLWAGRSKSKRLLVKIRLKGKKAPRLRVGQKADFVGMMLQATRAQEQGLDAADRSVLAKEGVYVIVSVADLDLH